MALAQGAQAQKYSFGMADFIIDEGKPTEIRFDGKLCEDGSYLQGDGGEVSLEPETEDIQDKKEPETEQFQQGAFDLFETPPVESEIEAELKKINISNMTPLQALNKLSELQNQLK